MIYAAAALGVGWLVWKRAMDVRHRRARTGPVRLDLADDDPGRPSA